jgi:O-methyltransferase
MRTSDLAGGTERHHARRRPSRGLRLGPTLLRHYAIWRRFRHATMVGRDAYLANLYLAEKCLAQPAMDGASIIECGTWRGGMAAGLAAIGGAARTYHFFDSFAGLPPPTHEDGEFARRAQDSRDGSLYFDNNTAALGEFMATLAPLGLPRERLQVHQGFFAATFPGVEVPPVAVLRLDADWYSSTLQCLEKFWERLIPGGLVLIDDYHAWEGCTKAVHAFLAVRAASEPIRESRLGKVAYIVKR